MTQFIKNVQKLLNKLGANPPLVEDGILGPKTELALALELGPEIPATPPPSPLPTTKTVKLGLVVGHTKAAPGAVMAAPYRVSEYVYNSEIAALCKARAPKNVQVEIFTRDVGGIVGAYNKAKAAMCDCIIELHFNAANTKASGTETLVSNEGADKQFGQIVQDEIEKVFGRINNGTGDRGLKVDPSRGGQSVNSFKGGANCLVEPFFGDNPSEAKMAMDRKHSYADSLWAAVVKWKALS